MNPFIIHLNPIVWGTVTFFTTIILMSTRGQIEKNVIVSNNDRKDVLPVFKIESRKDAVLGITLTKHTAFNVRIAPHSKRILIKDTHTERYEVGRDFYIIYEKEEPPIKIVFNDIDGRLYEQILMVSGVEVILTAPKEISKPFKSIFSKR